MAAHELILGGQRSGKSRCAESRAAAWLARPDHAAVLIATARPGDDEMRARIAQHRADRAHRISPFECREVPLELADAVSAVSASQTLVVVDCLTLWCANLLMPLEGRALDEAAFIDAQRALCRALTAAPGPVVMVSNEIGLGITPLGADARRYVDALGRLHQAIAALCAQVTLLVAGIEMPVKREAA